MRFVSCSALMRGIFRNLMCATAACGHPVAAMAFQAGDMTGMFAWRIVGSCIMCEVAVSAGDVFHTGRRQPQLR